MASIPPFELEDQTDEDFFDKLVNDDDDDDDVVDSGTGLKSSGLSEGNDVYDGDELNDVKAFANLSISESANVNDVSIANRELAGDNNAGEIHDVLDGDESNDVKAFANLSISQGGNVNDVSKVKREIVGDDNIGEVHDLLNGDESNEAKLSANLSTSEGSIVNDALEPPKVIVGDSNVEVPNSFSFDNEHILKNGGSSDQSGGSDADGVKEVQWSYFNDSGENVGGGFGSYSDFFTDLGSGSVESLESETKTVSGNEAVVNTSTESLQGHGGYQGDNGTVVEQSFDGGDINSTQYWENLYPGWKYDANTGQWYQLDGFDGTNNAHESGNVQGNFSDAGDSQWAISNVQTSQVSNAQQTVQTYQVANAQQTVQSAVGTVSQFSTTDYATGQDHLSQQYGQYQYPAHMIFDPQYPGWYYDTIAQEWRSLEAYHSSLESMNQADHQQAQNGFMSPTDYSHDSNKITDSGNYSEQGINVHQSANMTQSWSGINYSGGHSWPNSYSTVYSNSHVDHLNSSNSKEMLTSYDMTNQNNSSSMWVGESHSFVPATNTFQQFNHISQGEENGPVQYQDAYYSNQNVATVPQPFIPNGHHVAYAQSEGSSSAGRPPHALVTFGFGGKLVVMKDNSTLGFSSLAGKEADGSLISVLSLMEVVNVSNGPSGTGAVGCSYFHSLCHQSFPGPFVGGNAGSKELNKWIDDRITNSESIHMDYGKREALRLLLSLLKVACQHYGKLRSFGVDTGMMESDLPELAVAKLFASAKRINGQFSEYGAITKCFMNMPSEAQIQTTATEVQNLLISGRKKEALQRAQDGQFWGFALILAGQLGDQFFADTVKQMAVSQLVVGSPLRTLCLLVAKKPEEVFSTNIMAAGNMPGAGHFSPQFAQNAGYSMLDNWEENLAVITANRTENDHLVIIHLGDTLWKERNDVTAAHICYLVAEADFELYSDTARLCLVGADHWNFPRTYASPEAIQRTELFEYSKILGNSQFVLLPLQPYKLIYAHMLAEVGRISDSLKYCQAVNKSLKTGRSPEADTLKQLVASLEERIKTHQQSGYAANLAPTKIVGKLLTFFDSTAQRVVGGLPPPVPATTQGNVPGNDHQFQTLAPNVSSSQSVMSTPSLMSSASMEPINQWAVDGTRMSMQNRSISEPNIGRIPKPDQVDSANEATSSSSDGKQSGTKGTSRFGRLNFGAQILQKTVGLVLKPRQGRQAKLGESNKFYYDEKLKRWVEEGAEQPAEETALPPPPTTATFQNGPSDYNLKNAMNNGLLAADSSLELTASVPLTSSPGIPAIPPSSNQFSARGRMGVRSRYVDTFNKGGGAPTNLFQTPTVPSAKPAGVNTPKFFVPTPASSNEQPSVPEIGTQEVPQSESSAPMTDPFQNLAPSPAATMQRFPSVDNISNKRTMGMGNSSLSSQSRRTASWTEIHTHTYAPPATGELKASPLQFMPQDNSSSASPPPMNGGDFGDDLQEVEL